MKSVIAASLLASAAAFAPAKVAQSSVALKAAEFEDALGAQPPLGVWDPMGLLNGADEERFDVVVLAGDLDRASDPETLRGARAVTRSIASGAARSNTVRFSSW